MALQVAPVKRLLRRLPRPRRVLHRLDLIQRLAALLLLEGRRGVIAIERTCLQMRVRVQTARRSEEARLRARSLQ